jgi:hypothetical protein
MRFEWSHPDKELFEKHGFAVCTLSNGEIVGAIARSKATGRWTSTSPPMSHDSKYEAEKKLERNALGRIEFLNKGYPRDN